MTQKSEDLLADLSTMLGSLDLPMNNVEVKQSEEPDKPELEGFEAPTLADDNPVKQATPVKSALQAEVEREVMKQGKGKKPRLAGSRRKKGETNAEARRRASLTALRRVSNEMPPPFVGEVRINVPTK